MRLIFEIGHPGHVHLFKYAIYNLRERGHQVKIVTRDKDVTLKLLNDYGIEYKNISRQGRGTIGLMLEMLQRDWQLWCLARDFQPDVFLSLSMCSAQVATVTRKVGIILDDTEHAILERAAWLPFATVICTPEAYKLDLGHKHVRYKGYHELAYLHPNRFVPNPNVLSEIGLAKNDPFFIIRFVSWEATHDVGHHGFDFFGKKRLVAELQKLGRVIITSELPLPPELEPFRLNISPTKIHDLLHFSSLYIGEGATMASEAAMLGTPSIYVSSITAGTLEEQEQKYGLLHRITDEQQAIKLAIELTSQANIREEYQQRRQRMLADKVDVTSWLVDFIEGYPSSLKEKNERGKS